ncbi:uncharacterized protein LOC141628386 [Silene latifolia]|uniref:uncharacterized protein LOC141628386 n=1 Tax=Silene latifolia TaxID=37657 RepID=UPI003D7815E6
METINEEEELVDLLQFTTEDIKTESREALLKSGYYLFDNKPVVIKPWDVNMDLVKEKVDVVPVCVRLSGIPLKFWGKCLPRIAGLVGKYVKMDGATADKIRLSYARVMVELQMNQKLPEKVHFLDKTGQMVMVPVEYEWKPISCTSYKGMGHDSTQCRKPAPKSGGKKGRALVTKSKAPVTQIWRPIQKTQVVPDPTPPLFTPDVFPSLSRNRPTPVVKSTPAKQIMRLNRQSGIVGVRLSGKFGQYTFMDALNNTATPGGRVVESGKDLERLGGNTTEAEIEPFQECVSICCMEDVQATGALFTWSNKQEPTDRVYSRLDRAMGNQVWMENFGDYVAHFH